MVEVSVNILQVVLLIIAFVISFRYALGYRSREWAVAAFFYAVFIMADLFWMLIILFYHHNPVFYISEIGWYSAWLFLSLLLIMLASEDERIHRYKLLSIFPIFTLSMMTFFIALRGDPAGNVVSMLAMTFLMLRSGRGIIYLSRPESDAAGDRKERKLFYIMVMVYCIIEYCEWVLSCFWMGDTMRNPYFWLDIMLSVIMLLMVPALRKAVNR